MTQPGLVAPVGDQVPEPLGQHPGLARPGRGDDPGRAAGVRRRRPAGRAPARPWAAGPAGPTVSSPASIESRWTTASPGPTAIGWRGPPSHQRRRPVGQDARRPARPTARPPGGRPAPRATRPARPGWPGVVGVGPHQEVQPLPLRRSNPGSSVQRLGPARLGRLQLLRRRRPVRRPPAGAGTTPRAGRRPPHRLRDRPAPRHRPAAAGAPSNPAGITRPGPHDDAAPQRSGSSNSHARHHNEGV